MNTDPRRWHIDQGAPEPGAAAAQAHGQARNAGIRRVRHMSNWTAAALLVGTGAATVALATHAVPVGTTASTTSYASQGSAVQAGAPHVNGAVATSGGSGATTTVTRVVNGKTVVTHTAPAYQDH